MRFLTAGLCWLLVLIICICAWFRASKPSIHTPHAPALESSFLDSMPQSAPPPPPRLSLVMAGDALLHKALYLDAKIKDSENAYDFSRMVAPLAAIVAKHDLAFYNQESMLGGVALRLGSYPMFNSPQEFGDSMIAIGFNLISLANNHAMDRKSAGIEASLQYWRPKEEALGLIASGTYASLGERDNPKILEKNGLTYALLAYTYGTNGIPLPKGREYLVAVYDAEMLKRDLASLRPKVDLLIVSMHWGVEYSFKPTEEQRQIARLLASLGADIIIGHHPHVIQPIEFIDGSLVVYSLGNLLSGQVGLDRKVGMLVGLEAVKEPGQARLKLENIAVELVYTYHDKSKQNFKTIPFSKLDDSILPNAIDIQNSYLSKVGIDKLDFVKVGL